MRQYLLLLLVSTVPILLASAFTVSPFYSLGNSGCAQPNATTLKCSDGAPIVVSFLLSAQQYSLYYGNFSAHTFAAEEVSQPANIYGNPCTVTSEGTSVCFVTIPAIPITALNGTINRTIVVDLVSTKYPQINFTESFNISIKHYVNSTGHETATLYNYTSSRYNAMGPAYNYACDVYGICNETIGVALSNANQDIVQASSDISNGNISDAYIQSEYANISLTSINTSFTIFRNQANRIINNIVQAQYLTNSANISYADSLTMLEKCNETYATQIYSKLSSIGAVTPQEVINNSYSYFYAANSTNANITDEIKVCEGMAPASSSLSQTQLSSKQISSKAPASIPITYIVLFPAVIVVAYGILKAKDMRETIRIRMAANEHDRKKAMESNGHPGSHSGAEEHAHSEDKSHAQLPATTHQHSESAKPEEAHESDAIDELGEDGKGGADEGEKTAHHHENPA